MTEDKVEVKIGDDLASLADIAGIDMSDVSEVRTVILPAGKMLFKIIDAKIDSMEVKDTDNPGEKIKKGVILFECEVQNCFATVDDSIEPESLIGKKHTAMHWINNLAETMGRVKAFLVDIGIEANKPFGDLLTEAHGVEFVCNVVHTKDKNDPDRIFVNLRKVVTPEEYAESLTA